MNTLYILSGMPGSGKSTTSVQLAKAGVKVISTDNLRLNINNGIYPRNEEYIKIDPIIWTTTDIIVIEYANLGFDICIDATNLNQQRRRHWIDLVRARNENYKAIIIWHTQNYDSPERWLEERGITLPEYQAIITGLKKLIELPTEDECDDLVIK
ncbi:MAG: ATP-binding protein [Saprospiraceae bacterium]|nr:ATP-binding protein [Saprospiraceae bacterium]